MYFHLLYTYAHTARTCVFFCVGKQTRSYEYDTQSALISLPYEKSAIKYILHVRRNGILSIYIRHAFQWTKKEKEKPLFTRTSAIPDITVGRIQWNICSDVTCSIRRFLHSYALSYHILGFQKVKRVSR